MTAFNNNSYGIAVVYNLLRKRNVSHSESSQNNENVKERNESVIYPHFPVQLGGSGDELGTTTHLEIVDSGYSLKLS